ncbi:MAG: hypothetical protein PHV51_09715 [Methanosarcinaceae archaeon]|nr:hypothetical protein [Methanosarcinaceae archaeon]MDD4498407.1 hypothetical protein [Methanosarcinaceae archaeon]
MKKCSTPAQKNQKYIAIFLAATMFLSVFVVYFGGSNTDASEGEDLEVSGEAQPPMISFYQIPGKQVQHEFDSIADGLAMSPDGLVSARYINLQKTKGTPFESVPSEQQTMYYLYGGDLTKRYMADYLDGRHIELHQTAEPKIGMPRNVSQYDGYQLFARTNESYDIWNVVGNPVIFGSKENVKSVINVLEGNSSSGAGNFDSLLNYAEPNGAIFQEVVKRDIFVSIPAEKWYKDLKKLDDGSYSQTSIFLNPDAELTAQMNIMGANCSERGVDYNITEYEGNITKLIITADFESLNNETAMIMA